MVRLSFQNDLLPNVIESVVFDGALPAHSGDAVFGLGQRIHCGFPSAFQYVRVADRQVGPSYLEIDGGLHVRFVLGVEDSEGFVTAFGS